MKPRPSHSGLRKRRAVASQTIPTTHPRSGPRSGVGSAGAVSQTIHATDPATGAPPAGAGRRRGGCTDRCHHRRCPPRGELRRELDAKRHIAARSAASTRRVACFAARPSGRSSRRSSRLRGGRMRELPQTAGRGRYRHDRTTARRSDTRLPAVPENRSQRAASECPPTADVLRAPRSRMSSRSCSRPSPAHSRAGINGNAVSLCWRL